MEELIELIYMEKRPVVTPERRVKDFLNSIQRAKNGRRSVSGGDS
ncbi:hypothetical protein [Thermococcus peptonophilus]